MCNAWYLFMKEVDFNGVHKPTPGTPNNQFKMDVWWNNRFLV